MWDETKFLENKLTNLSEAEAAYSLREAYKRIIGEYPSNESLAVLIAQTALETGRWKSMHNGNWGNIKSRPTDGHYWTMFECDEIISGRRIVFKPPHDQCKFRAYLTPTDGAEDYIKFLTGARYSKALVQLKAGKVAEYTIALKTAGYFTANLDRYVAGMKSLYNEFTKKLANGLLEKYEPPPPPPPPAPPPAPEPEPAPEPAPAPQPEPQPEPQPDTPPAPAPDKKTNVVKSVGVMGALTAIYLVLSSLLQHCHH
jgi:hypothetical protein